VLEAKSTQTAMRGVTRTPRKALPVGGDVKEGASTQGMFSASGLFGFKFTCRRGPLQLEDVIEAPLIVAEFV
jgi:hypothetical protein